MQNSLTEAMANLSEDLVITLTNKLLSNGVSKRAVLQALNTGIIEVGNRFEQGTYFIADLIISGMIYQSAAEILFQHTTSSSKSIGRIVIGVVQGDLHNIGKDIVVSLLRAADFDVIDLGVDVNANKFCTAVKENQPDVLLLSGVLTQSQDVMLQVMDSLKAANLRDRVHVLIGGNCTNETLMSLAGADCWSNNIDKTVAFCKDVIGGLYEEE